MHIGIICYPSVGGSGIVATELGKCLAMRGHQVSFISSDVPFRLRSFDENIRFYPVETPMYHVMKEPPYLLALANKILEVHRFSPMDVIHAHYAVPHATAAFLAREMARPGAPRVVTTLHGTDITLLGNEPSFADSITFAINQSDGVTAVSASLRAETMATLPVTAPIRVIPNFLDCRIHRRVDAAELRSHFARSDEAILLHMSNFRPVKRLDLVLQTFAALSHEYPSRLVLVGDGPDARRAADLARELRVSHRVHFLGEQEEVVPLLSMADIFLLPSDRESFGLAALEAMACGTPVVATRVGGVPEVVADGETGLLVPPDDAAALKAATARLLADPALRSRMSHAAQVHVKLHFCSDCIVPLYEAFYAEVMAQSAGSTAAG